MIRHGSLFAGIEGFGVGFRQAGGFDTRWCVEIDPQCRRVLAHHFPGAYLHDDVTTAGAHNLAPVDVITFGFPCTDLSVAGKRAGLAGAASGLFWEAMRVIKELCPTVIVAENVVGLLNSHGGRDMAAVLWGIRDAGYGDVGWAVLDSQWFGVAQRRKRVFIVGSAGAVSPAEVLAFTDSLSKHPAPSRETREAGAGTHRDGTRDLCRIGFTQSHDGIVYATNTAGTFRAHAGGGRRTYVVVNTVARHLTPTETLRLQGFSDDHLDLDPPLFDSAKYRMTGNAVTVNVAEYIGRNLRSALEAA